MTIRRLVQLLGATLLVLIINVALSVLWVAVYSYLIEPGHDAAFYEAYAQRSAPYSSIIVGMPLVYLFGRWVGRWGRREAPLRNALTLWALYAGIDLAITGAAGAIGPLAPFIAVSIATKGVAAYLAGRAEMAARGQGAA